MKKIQIIIIMICVSTMHGMQEAENLGAERFAFAFSRFPFMRPKAENLVKQLKNFEKVKPEFGHWKNLLNDALAMNMEKKQPDDSFSSQLDEACATLNLTLDTLSYACQAMEDLKTNKCSCVIL